MQPTHPQPGQAGAAGVYALAAHRHHLAQHLRDVAADHHLAQCTANLATFDAGLLTAATLARVRHADVGWCAPEVLRVHAEDVARTTGPNTSAEADARFDEARTLAQAHGALAWELRIAMSLARHRRHEGHGADARAMLSLVRARLVETGVGIDLARADALMREWQ